MQWEEASEFPVEHDRFSDGETVSSGVLNIDGPFAKAHLCFWQDLS